MSDSESEENRIKYIDESKSYNYYFFYDQVNQGKIKDIDLKTFYSKKLIILKKFQDRLPIEKLKTNDAYQFRSTTRNQLPKKKYNPEHNHYIKRQMSTNDSKRILPHSSRNDVYTERFESLEECLEY
jgi:hypothetical protein